MPKGFMSTYSFKWRRKRGELLLRPKNEANPHIIITGMSGFGKSTLLKSMLSNVASSGIAAIIFDANNEFGDIAESLDGRVYNASYATMNILELDGASVAERISELVRLLQNVYSLGSVQATKLSECLWYTYRKKGARSRSDRSIGSAPKISDLIAEMGIFIMNSRTASEKNSLLHMKERLMLLNGGIDDRNQIEFGSLDRGISAFGLSNLKSAESQQIYISELLRRLYSSMHQKEKERGLNLYVMIDEAQFITGSSGSGGEVITKLTEEGRKFGIGVIIITHSANSLNRQIISNSSTFVAFYSREPSDVNYIAKILSGNLASREFFIRERLRRLRENEAIVMSSRLRDPLVVSTPTYRSLAYNPGASSHESAARILALVKRPARLDGARIDQTVLEELVERGIVDRFAFGGETWYMVHNPSLSIEHEVSVMKISERLRGEGVKHFIMDNSRGPDIVAYTESGDRYAIEYETGAKKVGESARMINSRLKSFSRVVIYTNPKVYRFYSSYFSTDRVSVMPMKEL